MEKFYAIEYLNDDFKWVVLRSPEFFYFPLAWVLINEQDALDDLEDLKKEADNPSRYRVRCVTLQYAV